MTEFWEAAFREKQMMWGEGPSRSAVLAAETFAARGAKSVLIPGVGYGRNAKPFLERGMSVTGIEISGSAIALARSNMHLDFPIHRGSVTDMPFGDQMYDGIFCYGLLYLLEDAERAKVLSDCARQLSLAGSMIFTVISKRAPMYGRGSKLGEDRYEILTGVKMFFYDAASIQREFGPHGLVRQSETDEPGPHGGDPLPFINAICTRQ